VLFLPGRAAAHATLFQEDAVPSWKITIPHHHLPRFSGNHRRKGAWLWAGAVSNNLPGRKSTFLEGPRPMLPSSRKMLFLPGR